MFVIGSAIPLGESDAVSSSGSLHNWCPANPFIGQFTKTSRFYCGFITEVGADSLIDDISAINNEEDSELVLGEWFFTEEISAGVTKISSFIKLETGSPSWSSGEAGFTWIKFEITTHLRIGRSTGRTDSDFASS